MIKLNQRDLNKLQRKFHALEAIDESGLTGELYRIGAQMNRDIKRSAPVDTGNLRNNIGFEAREKDVTIFSNAPYSKYVEEGWTTSRGNKVAAQPYFFGNIERNLKILIKNIEYRIKRAIR